jgi:hypothetical protein
MDAHGLLKHRALKNRRFDQPIDFADFSELCLRRCDVCREYGNVGAVMTMMRRLEFCVVIIMVVFMPFHIEVRVDLAAFRGFVGMKIWAVHQPGQQAGSAVNSR